MKQDGIVVPDLLPDFYSCSVLYIEPDPTMTKPIHAWYVTNMYPNEGATREGSRDLTASKEDLTIDIGFTGLTQTSVGVHQFAQKVLDSMNIANANPNMQPVFHHGNTDRNNPNSEASLAGQIAKDTGFHELVDKAATEGLRL